VEQGKLIGKGGYHFLSSIGTSLARKTVPISSLSRIFEIFSGLKKKISYQARNNQEKKIFFLFFKKEKLTRFQG